MKKLWLLLLLGGAVALMTAGCGVGEYTRDRFQSQLVHFDLDKYDLKPEARAILDYQAGYLKRFPGEKVFIIGNTDDRANDRYNMTLGFLRAEEVYRYLVRQGIDPSRIVIMTDGERYPRAPGHSESARTDNRRAEFVLITRQPLSEPPFYLLPKGTTLAPSEIEH